MVFTAFAQVRVAHGAATAGVATRIEAGEHRAQVIERMAGQPKPGEPALQRGIGQRRHAVAQHDVDAAVPGVRRADLGRRVGQHDAAEALQRMRAQPHAGKAAHRQTAEHGLTDLQGVEDGHHVTAQLRPP